MSLLPRMALRRRAVIVAVTIGAWTTPTASAQRRPAGSLGGIVRTADGLPVSDVLLHLVRDSLGYVARSDDEGRFLIASLAAGDYTLTAKRIGFDSAVAHGRVTDRRTTLDVVLNRRPVAFDTVRVRADFSGITGVVGDFSRMLPLGDASVRLLGGDRLVTTDSSGRFALELPRGRGHAVRVERSGFAPYLTSFDLVAGRRIELVVLLDSSTQATKDGWKWDELDQRQRVSRYGSARIARSELRATGESNLQLALQYTAAASDRGLTIPRAPCVFVDGVARPTLTLDAIPVSSVEFVEVYTRAGDVSGTLAARWPAGFRCGDGGTFTNRSVPSTSRGPTNQAQFVVIWMRAQ